MLQNFNACDVVRPPALLVIYSLEMISNAALVEAALKGLHIKIPLPSWCRHVLIKRWLFIELRNWTSAGFEGLPDG